MLSVRNYSHRESKARCLSSIRQILSKINNHLRGSVMLKWHDQVNGRHPQPERLPAFSPRQDKMVLDSPDLSWQFTKTKAAE